MGRAQPPWARSGVQPRGLSPGLVDTIALVAEVLAGLADLLLRQTRVGTYDETLVSAIHDQLRILAPLPQDTYRHSTPTPAICCVLATLSAIRQWIVPPGPHVLNVLLLRERNPPGWGVNRAPTC